MRFLNTGRLIGSRAFSCPRRPSSFLSGKLKFRSRTLNHVRPYSHFRSRGQQCSSPRRREMLKRVVVFVYGVASYGVFFATFLYAVGFLGNLVVPKTMDSPSRMPFWYALGIDLLLLGVFAVQHSLMARPWFKRAWTRIVPEPVERATYVLFSSLALLLLFWQWRPMGGLIWSVESPAGRWAIHGLYCFGWVILMVSTFLIDHFDLFGL